MKKSASVNVKFAKKKPSESKITGKVRMIGLSDVKCYKLIDIPCIKKQFIWDIIILSCGREKSHFHSISH